VSEAVQKERHLVSWNRSGRDLL